MDTTIIYTHPSSGCTVLVNEETGQKLYKIQITRRFVGSVTKVFRYEKAASSDSPNLVPPTHPEIDVPHEEAEPVMDSSGEEDGNGGEDDVVVTGGQVSDDDPSLAENEIARLYWKWFASARMVFEGKVRRRAEYMPFGDRLRLSFVFTHNSVSYRWSLRSGKRRPKLFINDSGKTLIARFHPASLFKKESAYMVVTPAGMDMLDHIIVTYIPVEVRRREM